MTIRVFEFNQLYGLCSQSEAMKRKDVHHDFSFISFSPRKSPRLVLLQFFLSISRKISIITNLSYSQTTSFIIFCFVCMNFQDVELLENMNEDPPIGVPQILEQGLLLQQQQQQQPFTSSSNNMLQMAVSPLSMLSSYGLEERAFVLYNQPLNTPFFKPPCSPDFPIVVNSALIPGLKGRYHSLPFVCSFCYGWMLCFYYYQPFFFPFYDIWCLEFAVQFIFVKRFKCVAMKPLIIYRNH